MEASENKISLLGVEGCVGGHSKPDDLWTNPMIRWLRCQGYPGSQRGCMWPTRSREMVAAIAMHILVASDPAHAYEPISL